MSKPIAHVPPHPPQEKESEPSHRKKNRLGRSARRRRRKLLDIENAERELLGGGKPADNTSILPKDRSLVWSGVIKKRNEFLWNEKDEAAIVGQLGYVPGNAIRVSARVSDLPSSLLHTLDIANPSDPVVLQLYPLALREINNTNSKSRKRKRQESSNEFQTPTTDVQPFPTIFWLTNSALRALISRLELEGMGVKLEERLVHDAAAQERMNKAHLSYGRERKNLILDEDWKVVCSRKWEPAFAESRGVAGIRNHAAIKCLHTHAAHYLAGNHDNVVGQWVLDEVEKLLEVKKMEVNNAT